MGRRGTGEVRRRAQKRARRRTLPRDLHPGAWWLWAIGLAAAASFTVNPVILLLIVAVASLVVVSRRSDAPWALSFRYYLVFGLVVIAIRVFFRILLGGGTPGIVVLPLPQIPLPKAARGIQLLGDVTLPSLLSGLYQGMQLAAIIICVGAANCLANPRRLLKSAPPALYEVGTALTVALAVFPQLAESVQRVHRARRLRGEPGKGVSMMRRIVVPVLEDALERSMTLAAGMDARGYGRRGTLSARRRLVNGTLMVSALIAVCYGAYAYLDATALQWLPGVDDPPRWLGKAIMLAGVVFAAVATWLAGRGVQRTRYRPDRWRTGEILAAVCGIAAAVGVNWAYSLDPYAVMPGLDAWPRVSLVAVSAVLVAALPAFCTPEPVLSGDDPARDAHVDADSVPPSPVPGHVREVAR